MARFRCIACGRDGEFVYDPWRHECPVCGSADVVFVLSIEELPDEFVMRWVGPSRMKTKLTGIDAVLLWILSDLHVELTRGWDLPPPTARPRFDALVVAGDLVSRMERGVAWLLERVPDRPVIYAAGNHEFYGTDIDRTVEKAKKAALGTEIFVVQNEAIRLGDVTFAGATLWTDFDLFGDQRRAMRVAEDRMNDFRKIRTKRYVEHFRPMHALARHMESRKFFEAEMRKPRSGPLVVISHHCPVPSPTPPPAQHASERLSDDEILEAAYRSDLTSLMVPAPDDGRGALRPADLWIFGHTHESVDTRVGATRLVSNSKGYGPWRSNQTWDNRRFDPNYVIEI
jgi:predicted phosphodiesterase